MLIYLLRLFNEAILRPAWAILDICWRLPYALYHGFRAGAVEAGLEIIPASILSGFVIAGVLLAFLWLCVTAARRLRIKDPGLVTSRIGAALFWLGCAIGIYFVGLFFYLAVAPEISVSILAHVAGTAALLPVLGWFARYILGGPRTIEPRLRGKSR